MDSNNMNVNYEQQTEVVRPGTEMEEPVSMGEWIVSFLLLMIPCVNIVLPFVWAFSNKEKKSKSNFFKAYLIFMAIMIVLSIVVLVIFGSAVAAILSSSYYY